MGIVKIAQLFKELASEIDELYDNVDCAGTVDCDNCPLMVLQKQWVNWKLEGTCIAELLLGEE